MSDENPAGHDMFVTSYSLVSTARKQLRQVIQEPAFSCFDGKELIKILMDLLKYEDDDLRLSSCKLLFDLHQVYMYIWLMLNLLLCYRKKIFSLNIPNILT